MNLFNDVDFCRKVLQKFGELFVSMTVNGNTVTMGNESEEQISDNPTRVRTSNLPTGITAQYGVEIKPKEWIKANHSQWQQSNPNGIVAYRINFKQFNTVAEANAGRIGNPFSIDRRSADTVEQFFEWLVTGNNFGVDDANEQYRQAIVNKILNTPENSKILYYTELNRPSHATIIGYLINNKHLLQQGSIQQTTSQPRQLSLFDNMSQEDLNAIEKQKEEHNKKCNR